MLLLYTGRGKAMGKINYKAIYDRNKHGWYDMTEDPQKYEALLAGHYSDSNHFVYELLQNAEDERADKVVIEYYSDKLVFYHNGDPFDEADVRGVSSMLMGTKDRDDAQTIGRFGMGFKSVFKYTYQPEIYSDDEAFKITRYLLPVEITEGWDFEAAKKEIICKLTGGRSFAPFSMCEHLTKIIIPFKKYGRNGELEAVPGDDVLQKLNELNGEILLFLTHIQNLYWVNRENGRHAMITLKQDENDDRLITCRIEGSEYGDKEEITRYLKYKDMFDHPEMRGAEVSVAYKLNSRADNINEVNDSDIWVYFPTRDNTDLPFLIHGSFETAVSREKLMTPSTFNSDLFEKLGDLIADSMIDLSERKLITQTFIRRVLIAAFADEENNETIPGLKEKVTITFTEKGLLPDRNGNYCAPADLMIPVPFKIGDFLDKSLFSAAFSKVSGFVAFNNEKEANFTAYYVWLRDDLKLKIYSLTQMAMDLRKMVDVQVPNSGENLEALKDFYDFLSDNRESVYKTAISWSRSGPYEQTIRNGIEKAWEQLREAPIILNRLNKLVPAYKGKNPLIYLAASSEYKSVMQSALVHNSIAQSFKEVLSTGFMIQEFNNFQYIKEKVIKKYIDIGDTIAFEDPDNYEDEYLEDISQILALLEASGDIGSIVGMLKEANIIKVKTDDGSGLFTYPGKAYVRTSDEGIDLSVYFAPIPDDDMGIFAEDEEETSYIDFEMDEVDESFYEEHGISISKLKKLGLITTPVSDGPKKQDGVGDGYWVAMGEYCPRIQIEGLEDNLYFIENHPDDELAKRKSAEILKLALLSYRKMRGKKRFRKNNPYEGKMEAAYVLHGIIRSRAWLFDKNSEVQRINKLSRYDLNPAIYKEVQADKAAYLALGFVEKEADSTADTFEQVGNLDKKDKMLLLKQLARELGKEVIEQGSATDPWNDDDQGGVFDPMAWQDTEFPNNRIRNLDNLIRHVQEQFYCADPISYKKVWRRIRISKSSKTDRAYAIGMYTNGSDVKICQACKQPIVNIQVDQIANYGIEMPQLNLCMCNNCAAQYKAVRDGNKEVFRDQMKNSILSLDISAEENEYIIQINADLSLHFTQTHVAELQEIFRLLNEYGTPAENVDLDEDSRATGPLMHPARKSALESYAEQPAVTAEQMDLFSIQEPEKKEPEQIEEPDVARRGCFITYKKSFAGGETYDNTLQPDKFPLHKAFEGHRVGDVVVFQGKQYEIIGIL